MTDDLQRSTRCIIFVSVRFEVTARFAAKYCHGDYCSFIYLRPRPKGLPWRSLNPSADKIRSSRLVYDEALDHLPLTFWTMRRRPSHWTTFRKEESPQQYGTTSTHGCESAENRTRRRPGSRDRRSGGFVAPQFSQILSMVSQSSISTVSGGSRFRSEISSS